MDDVEPHVTGTRDADQRVEVRTVVVHERTGIVCEPRDLRDVLLEDAQRVRIGQHDSGNRRVEMVREIVDINGAVVIALHGHDVEAARRRGRRVGAVRRVGDEHARASGVSTIGVVRLDHAQPRPLAVRARRGLQRHARHPSDRRKQTVELPHQLERPLRVLLGLVGMQLREAVEPGELLVDHRVVLHRAGTERIHPLVEVVIAPCEASEVAREHRLRYRRNRRWGRPQQRIGIDVSPLVAGTPAEVTAGPVV